MNFNQSRRQSLSTASVQPRTASAEGRRSIAGQAVPARNVVAAEGGVKDLLEERFVPFMGHVFGALGMQ